MRGFVCRAFTVGEQPGVPDDAVPSGCCLCDVPERVRLYPCASERDARPGWLLCVAPKRHQGLRRRLRTSDRLLQERKRLQRRQNRTQNQALAIRGWRHGPRLAAALVGAFARAPLVWVCALLLAAGCTTKNAPDQPNALTCGLGNYPGSLIGCTFSGDCRATLACNRKCSELAKGGAGEQACHLLCQVEEGRDSACYRKVVQCFADHRCLPRARAGKDGICPVTTTTQERVIRLTDISTLEGTWHELRGRNCGREGSRWQGGYDALKCRSSSWVPEGERMWYHTSFAGSAGIKGKLPYLIAKPKVTADGGLEVHYTNPPLTPQDERWYVLSRPQPD